MRGLVDSGGEQQRQWIDIVLAITTTRSFYSIFFFVVQCSLLVYSFVVVRPSARARAWHANKEENETHFLSSASFVCGCVFYHMRHNTHHIYACKVPPFDSMVRVLFETNDLVMMCVCVCAKSTEPKVCIYGYKMEGTSFTPCNNKWKLNCMPFQCIYG